MYHEEISVETTASTQNNRCNHNKKRKKKGSQEPHPSKGEDITFMFGMKFDDDNFDAAEGTSGQKHHPKYTSTPEMKTLMSVFPSIPPETIYAILEDNFGNVELTAEELQCQVDALSQAKRTPNASRKPKSKGDDAFPRLDSDRCRTAAVTPRSAVSSKHTPKSEWGTLQELPPPIIAAPTPTTGTGLKIRLELTAAGLLNYKELAKKYTFLPEGVLYDVFINAGQSYTMTVLRLWEMFPDAMEASGSPPPSPPSSPSPVAFTTAAKIAKKPNEKGFTSIVGGGDSAPRRRDTGGDTLYTTEDFIEPVLEARRAIENLKRSRNVTIAYKGGNVKTNVPADEYKMKAEDLLSRGVEEAARIGAAIITRQKGFVDFHHLTVNETLGVLESLMERLAENRHSHGVLMVTGLGKHSSDGKAHLMPAVEQWLSQRGIRYSKKTGSVFVRL